LCLRDVTTKKETKDSTAAPPGVSIIPLLEALNKRQHFPTVFGQRLGVRVGYVVRRLSRRDEDMFVVIFDFSEVYGLPSASRN